MDETETAIRDAIAFAISLDSYAFFGDGAGAERRARDLAGLAGATVREVSYEWDAGLVIAFEDGRRLVLGPQSLHDGAAICAAVLSAPIDTRDRPFPN